MDLALDRNGSMLGVTSTVNPSNVPARLYRIDLAAGKATKIVDLVGSTSVMGLALGRDGKRYATDYAGPSGFYLVDPKSGVETTLATLPFGYSSGLELMNPKGSLVR